MRCQGLLVRARALGIRPAEKGEAIVKIRSVLLTNGLRRDHMEKASRSEADAVLLELEDGVPGRNKSEARDSILWALQELDWSGKSTFVRIPNIAEGSMSEDIQAVAKGRPTAFVLAKCRGADEVQHADRLVGYAEGSFGYPFGSIGLGATIETVKGLANVESIASASPRMCTLDFGGDGDFAVEMKARRDGRISDYDRGPKYELSYGRTRSILAARMAGLSVFTMVYRDSRDADTTLELAQYLARFGFDGGITIFPRQLAAINEGFGYSDSEIEWAMHLVTKWQEVSGRGEGAWMEDGAFFGQVHARRAALLLEDAGVRAPNA